MLKYAMNFMLTLVMRIMRVLMVYNVLAENFGVAENNADNDINPGPEDQKRAKNNEHRSARKRNLLSS